MNTLSLDFSPNFGSLFAAQIGGMMAMRASSSVKIPLRRTDSINPDKAEFLIRVVSPTLSLGSSSDISDRTDGIATVVPPILVIKFGTKYINFAKMSRAQASSMGLVGFVWHNTGSVGN
jgi:hypothetical protein